MSNITALSLAILAVILNGLIGHFFAPNGIMLTPVVLTITTHLVCFRMKNIKVIVLSVLTFLFVAFNDIIIKLYSGGTHDKVGLGWVHLMLFVGLVPTLVILIVRMFRGKEETVSKKIIALILFIGLLAGHLQLFGSLGLGRYYWYDWNG